MNTIERRVSDLLRAHGEGLEMTTQDINRLEQELEHQRSQLEVARRGRRRNRVVQVAVAACAVTGVVLGALALRDDAGSQAPPAGAPPVTLAQLQGIWRVDGSDWLWRFTADGRLIQSNAADILTRDETVSEIRPVSGGFIQQNPSNPADCVVWSATISAEGRLRGVEGGATAAGCAGTVGSASGGPTSPASTWVLTRMSPVSVAGAAAVSTRPGGSKPTRVTVPSTLTGTWLRSGSGTILTVTSGRYAVQDLSTDPQPQTGAVSVRPEGTIVFTPQGAPGCPAEYSSATSSAIALETRLAPGSCDRLGATVDSWVRLN